MSWNKRCPEEELLVVPRGRGESCLGRGRGRGTENQEGVLSEGAARDVCFVKRLALALLDCLPK